MGIPAGCGHYVISGSVATSERWAFGWWVSDSAKTFGANLDNNAAWGPFRDWLLAAQYTDFVMDSYDYYRYDSGNAATFHDHVAVNHVGTGGGGAGPLQLSCVLSLRTATLSRQGRGRVYLPMTDLASYGTGHLLNAGRVDGLVDKFSDFLTTQHIGSDAPVVVSRAGSAMHVITSCSADYVPDTQRRRSNKLKSTSHAHSVG